MKVDINCDMGESFGLYQLGNDEEMMKYISSVNIACGFHAGDPSVMRRTVQLAKQYGVSVGAHPGFPDLLGFGRRYMNCTPEEIQDYVIYQIGALREFANIYGVEINHCKPHGALYIAAMEDEKIARPLLEAIAQINDQMIVYALNNSAVVMVADQMGIPVAKEVYSDREHKNNGFNVLTRFGPTIQDFEAAAARVVRMVKNGKVITNTGEDIDIQADTVCIHGDTPGAPQLARAIFAALAENGIEIVAR